MTNPQQQYERKLFLIGISIFIPGIILVLLLQHLYLPPNDMDFGRNFNLERQARGIPEIPGSWVVDSSNSNRWHSPGGGCPNFYESKMIYLSFDDISGDQSWISLETEKTERTIQLFYDFGLEKKNKSKLKVKNPKDYETNFTIEYQYFERDSMDNSKWQNKISKQLAYQDFWDSLEVWKGYCDTH